MNKNEQNKKEKERRKKKKQNKIFQLLSFRLSVHRCENIKRRKWDVENGTRKQRKEEEVKWEQRWWKERRKKKYIKFFWGCRVCLWEIFCFFRLIYSPSCCFHPLWFSTFPFCYLYFSTKSQSRCSSCSLHC